MYKICSHALSPVNCKSILITFLSLRNEFYRSFVKNIIVVYHSITSLATFCSYF